MTSAFSWQNSISLCPASFRRLDSIKSYYKKKKKEQLIIATLRNAAAKSLQSCPTLCDPIDGSPPGSPIPGILQARALEWVATSFPNA